MIAYARTSRARPRAAPTHILRRARDQSGAREAPPAQAHRGGFSLASVPARPPILVGGANDPAEAEADRAAERVIRGETVRMRSAAPPTVKRKCETCQEEEALHRSPSEAGFATDGGVAPPIVQDVLARPGEPLDPGLRAGFESRFGASFAGVRIHADADGAARALGARAFTLGERIGFAAGAYSPGTAAGQRLLAHELAHVAQGGAENAAMLRRNVGTAPAPAPAAAGPGPPAPAPGAKAGKPAKAERISVDVLSAVDPEDFLVKAAADSIGADIRVSSMTDMVDKLAALAGSGKCIERIRVYNHGNPQQQSIVRGAKSKSPDGKGDRSLGEGFSLTWLLDDSNQAQLGKLRGTLCCGPALSWYGCSTAGVWAKGGNRTEAEQKEDRKRYTAGFADWYHSVDEALARGVTEFKAVGLENIQSWSNALCASITAATDFTSWSTSFFGSVSRTVIYGGNEVRYGPQANINCSCEPSGKLGGPTLTGAQLRGNADYLRDYFLRPVSQKATGLLGREQKEKPPETAADRESREKAEAAEAAATQARGTAMRGSVLTKAGFAAGAAPANAEEALRVTAIWGVDLARIVARLPVQTASTAQKTTGRQTAATLGEAQAAAIAALDPKARSTFMSALLLVQQESFWRDYLATHTVHIIPDVTGTNYGGYTQTGTRRDSSGRIDRTHAIHMSIELLKLGDAGRVAATIVHELSHQLDEKASSPAMQPFLGELATLIAGHPDIVALRAGAADPAEAEARQLRSINQILYEATTYAEDEIFVHLEQLTHQPAMNVGGTSVRASAYITTLLEGFVRQLRRIGFPRATENELLLGVYKRAMRLYERRIAAAPEGSEERRRLDINKRMAAVALDEAIKAAAKPPPGP